MSRKTRKLMWSVPLIAAVAVIGALAAFMTLQPGGLFAHDGPGTPQLTATPDGRTAIVLSWTGPDGDVPESGYRIDRSADGHLWRALETVDGMETSYRDTDVKAGDTWFYRIFAMDFAGTGAVSPTVPGTTPVLSRPSKVEGLEATAVSNDPTRIVLTWNAPTDNGGTPVTRYCINIAEAANTDGLLTESEFNTTIAGIATACQHNSNPTSASGIQGMSIAGGRGIIVIEASDASSVRYEHKYLRAEQTWRYQVYAVNSVGVSTLPSSLQTEATSDAIKPVSPANLTAVPVVTGSVTADITEFNVRLYWHWPTMDGGAPLAAVGNEDAIRRYRIEVSEGTNWPDRDATGTASTGSSATTIVDAADATEFDVYALAAPDAAQVIQFTHTGITAANFPGSTITLRYRVYTETGTDEGHELRSRVPAQFMLTVPKSALVAATTADPRDAAGDPIDLNQWSRAPAFLADDDAPAGGDNPGEIDLDWTLATVPTGHNKPVSYRLDVSRDGIRWQQVEEYTNVTEPKFTHGELRTTGDDAARTYHYRVFPYYTKIGVSSLTSGGVIATPATAPGKVDGITANAVNSGQIDVRWNEPSNNGGDSIKRYCISVWEGTTTQTAIAEANCTSSMAITTSSQLRAINTAQTGVIVVGADSTTYMHKGLLEKKTWNYQIVAVNGSATPGFSTANAESESATTPAASKPDAPNGLAAESAKDSSYTRASQKGVLLLWNAPSDPAGAAISSYRVYRKVMDEDDDFVPIAYSNPRAETYYTDEEEPAEDEVRYYRVAAINSAGEGAMSDTVRYPIDPEHVHNNAPTTVGMIADMEFTVGDMASTMDVMGYFNDADGDTLTYSAMSDDMAVATASITGSTLTVTPMGEGTAEITVTATDMDGSGMSATQTFDVMVAAAPAELMAPRITGTNPVGSGIVLVSWSSVDGATGYSLIATNLTDPSAPTRTAAADADDNSGQIQNLAAGDTYLVFVAAFNDELEFKLSEYVEVTTDP